MRKYHCIDKTDFGNRSTHRRKELKLSQKVLAEMLDCNESYISKLENGNATPTLDVAYLVAQKLGVGVDYFLPSTISGLQIMQLEIQERLRSCSPELTQFIYRVLEDARSFESDLRSENPLHGYKD